MKQKIKATSTFLLLLVSYSHVLAQHYYVAYNPKDCMSCLKGIELFTNTKKSLFFFQEQYKVDSINIKNRYLFDEQAEIIFSDSLFNKYSLDGYSTISNKNGTLKYSSKII